MMGLSLWSENSAKSALFCEQHGQHRAGCVDASMVGLSLWSRSENSAKLALFYEQHGQGTRDQGRRLARHHGLQDGDEEVQERREDQVTAIHGEGRIFLNSCLFQWNLLERQGLCVLVTWGGNEVKMDTH